MNGKGEALLLEINEQRVAVGREADAGELGVGMVLRERVALAGGCDAN